MEIRELTDRDWPAWLDFFDHRAFCDNPSLQSCYCTYFYRPGPRGMTNRSWAVRLLEEGRLRGAILVDKGGTVRGWASAHRKSAFSKTPTGSSGEEDIYSIQCFVIEEAFRGQGHSKAMIGFLIGLAVREGCSAIEAYPRPKARTAAGSFHGPYKHYRDLGFQDWSVNGKFCVRLPLEGRAQAVEPEPCEVCGQPGTPSWGGQILCESCYGSLGATCGGMPRKKADPEVC